VFEDEQKTNENMPNSAACTQFYVMWSTKVVFAQESSVNILAQNILMKQYRNMLCLLLVVLFKLMKQAPNLNLKKER
jgi:hypothetical protein